MNAGAPLQKAALTYCALLALIVLAYFFADRQLAGALKPITGGVKPFPWLTYIAKVLGPLASIAAAVVAARALARGSLTPAEDAILRAACATLIAWTLKEELKWVFGRTWPETWLKPANPSYFGGGTYGFFPFHGGKAYASFPSGHTTAITTLAGSIWVLWPKLRWLGVALSLCVAVGLLGAGYHWLSDVIAGAILGVTTGMAAAKIGRQSPERR